MDRNKSIEIEIALFAKGNTRCCTITTPEEKKEYTEISLGEISEKVKDIIQSRKEFFEEIEKKKIEKENKKKKRYQFTQRAATVEEAANQIEQKIQEGFLYVDMINTGSDYLIIYIKENQEQKRNE